MTKCKKKSSKVKDKEMPDNELLELIKDIVDEKSGGIKFTELITDVFSWQHEHKYLMSDPENLLSLIRNSKSLKILEYGMDLGVDMKRVKYFIYHPL